MQKIVILVSMLSLGGCAALNTDLSVAQTDLKAGTTAALNATVKYCPAAVAGTAAVAASVPQGTTTATTTQNIAQATLTVCAAATAAKAAQTSN